MPLIACCLSDLSPIIGYPCQISVTHSLTISLTDSCLVDLMAFYDANCLMMSQQLLYCGKLFFKVGKRLCELSTSGWGCQTLDKYAIWSWWGTLPNQKFSWIDMINLPTHVTKCGKIHLAFIVNCIWYLSRYASSPPDSVYEAYCKSLPFFFFLTFEKGRLLYIHPVGWSVGWLVGRLTSPLILYYQ